MSPLKPHRDLRRLAEGFLGEHGDVVEAAFTGVARETVLAEVERLMDSMCARWLSTPVCQKSVPTLYDYWETYRADAEAMAAREADPLQRQLLSAMSRYLLIHLCNG